MDYLLNSSESQRFISENYVSRAGFWAVSSVGDRPRQTVAQTVLLGRFE